MRLAPGVVALACLGLGGFLAWHHVLSPILALAAFLAWTAAVFRRPSLWQIGVPAALPLVGLAPWTGVLVTEEWDLVVLGAAAGAYAARALREPAARTEGGEAVAVSKTWWTIFVLFVFSALIALCRGVLDAGTPALSWTAGYYDTLNSVRVEKALALALLLAPLLVHALRTDGERAWRRLFAGFALAGVITALVVVWERVAFPGLLNFSTDYRVTGPFWEMHVGGAALDGFVALTLPFALFALLRARRAAVLAATIVGVAIIVYAGLVTFSRGVYLALPVSIVVLALLLRVRPGGGHAPPTASGALRLLAFLVVALVASHLAFAAAGYRGLGAALGTFALTLPAIELARGTSARQWGFAALLCAGAAVLSIAIATLLPKGIYLMYATAAAASAALPWRVRRGNVSLRVPALACAGWLIAMAVAVAVGWAGQGALAGAVVAVALFVGLGTWLGRVPLLARRARWQAQAMTVGIAAVLATVVAVFSGGAYMAGRFATGSADLEERLHHWRDGLAMLDGPGDWLLGKGAGRFPGNYLFRVRDAGLPGSYHLDTSGEHSLLTLAGPRYSTGIGDLFRVSQRVPARPGRYVLSFSARAPQDVRLHVEICEKHLLYDAACGVALVPVRGAPGEWQRVEAPIDAHGVTGGAWYERRPAYFSLAVETSERSVDLTDLRLAGPDGREVLVNGDFARGMARWFFSSDRYHLPWHAKSLPLNVLYDQGAIGLGLFALLVLGVLARLAFGRARAHPGAPFVAAALCGFLVVGAFDSLTDVPRVAFAFWLVLLLGALIDGRAAGAAAPVSGTRR